METKPGGPAVQGRPVVLSLLQPYFFDTVSSFSIFLAMKNTK